VAIFRGAVTDECAALQLFDCGTPRGILLFEEGFEVSFEACERDATSGFPVNVTFRLNISKAVRIAVVCARLAIADMGKSAVDGLATNINASVVVECAVDDESVTTNDAPIGVCVELRHGTASCGCVYAVRWLWLVQGGVQACCGTQ
jgi:hypothetical protein